MSETISDSLRPPLDRTDVDPRVLSPVQQRWREQGYVILEGLIPDDVIEAYQQRFRAYHNIFGFETPTPYEHVAEIRAMSLHPGLRAVIDALIGDEMILHLNLTPQVSTSRKWHQDDYLNPPEVNGWYLATWIALDDITPDSGPFELIPGSHTWPVLRRERVMALMSDAQAREDRDSPQSLWTSFTEQQVSDSVEERRRASNSPIVPFLGRRGDVLAVPFRRRVLRTSGGPD